MKTEMGKGVDFMEGTHKWHGIAPNDDQLADALNQLESSLRIIDLLPHALFFISVVALIHQASPPLPHCGRFQQSMHRSASFVGHDRNSHAHPFVFDASNSMNAFWGGQRKIETATRLLGKTLAELRPIGELELGLRVYGHGTRHVPGQQNCDDTELVVPFGSNNPREIE